MSNWSVPLILSSLAGLAWMATVPVPAGACSIECPGDVASYEMVQVRRVDGDPDAVAPFWDDEAVLLADIDGTPTRIVVDDRVYYFHQGVSR